MQIAFKICYVGARLHCPLHFSLNSKIVLNNKKMNTLDFLISKRECIRIKKSPSSLYQPET